MKKKRQNAKEEAWNKRHASGRVRLTVTGQYYSFSSQWLVTDCLCYTPKNRQGDKHQSSTHPRPSTRHFPFSNFIFYPVKTSATLLPAFQLLYPQQVTSSGGGGGGGGEMVYKCTSCGGIIYCMMRSNRRSYELKVGSWPPCWRWTGLLHLLWEADCRGEEVEVGGWGKDWGRRETSY